MHLAKFRRERGGRSHVAHLPAGDVIGFAEAADNEGAGGKASESRRALVLRTIKHHVLIHLIADEQHLSGRKDLLELEHFCLRPDRGARVVRAVDENGAGFLGDRGAYFVEIGAEGVRSERHAHHRTACQLNIGHITVVARLQHDHFITGSDSCQDDRDDPLRRPCSDGDFIVCRVLAGVECFYF